MTNEPLTPERILETAEDVVQSSSVICIVT